MTPMGVSVWENFLSISNWDSQGLFSSYFRVFTEQYSLNTVQASFQLDNTFSLKTFQVIILPNSERSFEHPLRLLVVISNQQLGRCPVQVELAIQSDLRVRWARKGPNPKMTNLWFTRLVFDLIRSNVLNVELHLPRSNLPRFPRRMQDITSVTTNWKGIRNVIW